MTGMVCTDHALAGHFELSKQASHGDNMLNFRLLQGKSSRSGACGARYLAAEEEWNVSICLPCEAWAFCLVLANHLAQAVQKIILVLFSFPEFYWNAQIWPNKGMQDLLRLLVDCRHGPQSISETSLLPTQGTAPLYVGCCFLSGTGLGPKTIC